MGGVAYQGVGEWPIGEWGKWPIGEWGSGLSVSGGVAYR